MSGTLYGVGLGPGAPDLITLRAARLIEAARVVAYPTLAGGASFARSIAAGLIAPDAREIAMDVPMTVERGPAQAAFEGLGGTTRANSMSQAYVVHAADAGALWHNPAGLTTCSRLPSSRVSSRSPMNHWVQKSPRRSSHGSSTAPPRAASRSPARPSAG